MDSRAVSPIVEKVVAVGIVALFVSGFVGALLGGVVPDYRAATGQEVGERVLARAAQTVERAIPSVDGPVRGRATAQLPATIADRGYHLELDGRTLRLDHPNPNIGASTRVAVPATATVRNGTWQGGDFVVRVRGPGRNRTLSIGAG